MPIDRAATLRQAEKLLRQGKLDLAIGEYLRLVEDQPRDWNTANVLGDLYARAGQADRAVEQFSRIAESLKREGFFSKASALYKKILKLRPDDDAALMQAGELAAVQGLLADARTFFAAVAQGRRQRADVRGALQVTIRVGELDKADVAARLAAARARHELDDRAAALREYADIAAMLVDAGRDADAEVALRELLALDPANAQAAAELTRILVAQGCAAEAASLLTPEAMAAHPELVVAAAGDRLRSGDADGGLELLDTLLANDPACAPRVCELALDLAADRPDIAFSVVDRVVSVRIADHDWSGAADALASFASRVPGHIGALTRLVDVCVDGELETRLIEAQLLLIDAYVAAGAFAEARHVSEDLVTRHPSEAVYQAKLGTVLAAEGAVDPGVAVADWLSRNAGLELDDEPFSFELPELDKPDPHAIDLAAILGEERAPQPPPAPGPAPAIGSANVEEDLSIMLDTMKPSTPALPAPRSTPAQPSEPASPPADLDSVFAQLRTHAAHRSPDEAADVAYTRGAAMLESGEIDAAVEQFRAAARSPHRRFAAALTLAQLYERQQRTAEAVEWLGHAADAPGITASERFATLYRLATILESSGEPASALAACLELQADAGDDYRDVAVRIARLTRSQAGG